MSDTKHPAEVLADTGDRGPAWHNAADDMLRRIPALEAEIARLKEHAVVLANAATHVEREACALECDRLAEDGGAYRIVSQDCAELIRARKDTHE